MKKNTNWKSSLWLGIQKVEDWRSRQTVFNCQELRKQGIGWNHILKSL